MPRKYVRKCGVPQRAAWTEEQLFAAMDELRNNNMGINQIARTFGIPSRTLRRRFAKNEEKKLTLGKHPILGFENEKRLVRHIQKLESVGFPPETRVIRQLAHEFAEKLGIKHTFNEETQMAGHQWLQTFLERNPELSIKQSEGLSVARAMGLNRQEVSKMYDLLVKVCADNDLLDKPERIYNMDETGVQTNNKAGKVIATKGSKAVSSITSCEKGETLSVIACCNAIGNFLPPVIIIKGVNKKPEFEDGLPPGSKVFMNKKSAYVNSALFLKWLTDHFIPQNPQGKVLLVLDGHSSHSSAIDMLEIAEKNDVILFCLPSHTTQALQPLDRAFFKPFKNFLAADTNRFMRTHPTKKLSRYNLGPLIGNAWTLAGTPAVAKAGFRSCGLYPINPHAIPDAFFAVSDFNSAQDILKDQTEVIRDQSLTDTMPMDTTPNLQILEENESPSKYLEDSSPVPKIPLPIYKRGKQSAAVLNSIENINAKARKNRKNANGIPARTMKCQKKRKIDSLDGNTKKKLSRKRHMVIESSSESENNVIATNKCIECTDDYETTTSKSDWIQCRMCKGWLHEDCTMYGDYCNKCGRIKRIALKGSP